MNLGATIIPGAALGVLLGGYLVKRYDWDCRQILRFCTIVAFVSALCLGIVLMGCDGRRVGRFSCHILTLLAIGSTIWPYAPQPENSRSMSFGAGTW